MVFHHRHTVLADGQTIDVVMNDTILQAYEAPGFAMDFDQLRDSNDEHYAFVTDIQTDAHGGMTWDFKLLRSSVELMSEAEREAAFREAFPQATEAEVSAYLTGQPYGEPSRTIDPSVLDWIADAPEDERRPIGVQLFEEPTIQIPRARGTLAEPVHFLEQQERRLVAIEARRTEILTLQADVIDDLEARGGDWIESIVLINAFEALVGPEQALWLTEDPRVKRVYFEDVEPDGVVPHTGTGARHFHQVQQFVDYGYDGSLGSTLNTMDRMLVGVIDNQVDSEHPAFRDDAQGNRRLMAWERPFGFWMPKLPSTWNPNGNSHGTIVVSQLTASLTAGQDPNVHHSQRDARSGMSPEPFVYFWSWNPSLQSAANHATTAQGVDLLSVSGGWEKIISVNTGMRTSIW